MQFADAHTVQVDQNSDFVSEIVNPILLNIYYSLIFMKLVTFKTDCLLTSPRKLFCSLLSSTFRESIIGDLWFPGINIPKKKKKILSNSNVQPEWGMIQKSLYLSKGFPSGSAVKNLSAVQETQVGSLSPEDPLEEGMATHPSILIWRIPWTEKPGGATVHRITKNGKQLKQLRRHAHTSVKFQLLIYLH